MFLLSLHSNLNVYINALFQRISARGTKTSEQAAIYNQNSSEKIKMTASLPSLKLPCQIEHSKRRVQERRLLKSCENDAHITQALRNQRK